MIADIRALFDVLLLDHTNSLILFVFVLMPLLVVAMMSGCIITVKKIRAAFAGRTHPARTHTRSIVDIPRMVSFIARGVHTVDIIENRIMTISRRMVDAIAREICIPEHDRER